MAAELNTGLQHQQAALQRQHVLSHTIWWCSARVPFLIGSQGRCVDSTAPWTLLKVPLWNLILSSFKSWLNYDWWVTCFLPSTHSFSVVFILRVYRVLVHLLCCCQHSRGTGLGCGQLVALCPLTQHTRWQTGHSRTSSLPACTLEIEH